MFDKRCHLCLFDGNEPLAEYCRCGPGHFRCVQSDRYCDPPYYHPFYDEINRTTLWTCSKCGSTYNTKNGRPGPVDEPALKERAANARRRFWKILQTVVCFSTVILYVLYTLFKLLVVGEWTTNNECGFFLFASAGVPFASHEISKVSARRASRELRERLREFIIDEYPILPNAHGTFD